MSNTMKAFLCHSHHDSEFVIEVAKHLKRSLDDVYAIEDGQVCDQPYFKTINEKLEESNIFVVFVGGPPSQYIIDETALAHRLHTIKEKRQLFIVLLNGLREVPRELGILGNYPCLESKISTPEEAYRVAKEIIEKLDIPWRSVDGLPSNPHIFSYEKDVIQFFVHKEELENQLEALRIQMEKADPKQPDYDKLNEKFCDLQKEYELIRRKQLDGCPASWPKVVDWEDNEYDNQIPEDVIGTYRPRSAMVAAAGLSSSHISEQFSFPEAGPRAKLVFPTRTTHARGFNRLRVAIIVSGGIAPGINAVIDGITQRHYMYAKAHQYPVDILGFRYGFGAFDNLDNAVLKLKPKSDGATEGYETSSHAHEGGSILETSRYEDLLNLETRPDKLDDIYRQLLDRKIDILYVLGGDGSMRAAHAIWKYAQDRQLSRKLSVVAIPKTMDNDILWVWQTFGFLTAVGKAMEFIENLYTEVKSNPRLGVLQLFGSDSGFVVSHAVLASRTRVCDVALIPEINFNMVTLARYMCQRMWEKGQAKPYGFVVMSETAIPTDALNYIDEPEIGLSEQEKQAVRVFSEMREQRKRVQGQTEDALRTAGLKIVSRGLQKLLKEVDVGLPDPADWSKVRVFTNEPRHLLRSTPPSTADIITAQRLGILAVDNALAGYTDCMVSQWLTEYVLVPLELVVLGRKRIPQTGIFWKQVLAKTGQPSNLDL
jgi:6-phosphofructokinase 1